MARSQYKSGGPKQGTFKPKRMGKGYMTARKEPIGSRPVLRITEPVDKDTGDAKKNDSASSEG